ncbi:hypothetical protein GCM10009789_13140 [Kribbella sancticallisti]|uniref:Uncharacterized protein n=1 Tax=Kribbella sancticallisti TaxID=460087 RepID=A0ABN2CPZ0_9ACTN
MFALSSSHCPAFPYAAGSAPRLTQYAPDLLQLVRGTEPVRIARAELAIVMFAFGRIVWLIRCRPAAKQTVEPAGWELTTDWAFWPGLITTPLQGPATAGPASLSPTAGSAGLVVVVVVGSDLVAVLVGVLLADDVGPVVGGLVETVPGAWVGFTVGSLEGRTAEPDGPFWAASRDLSADAAFLW